MNRLLLEILIRQILSEEGFTKLSVRSFVDHDTRTNKFVDALDATKEGGGTPLTLVKGDDKVLVTRVQIIKKAPKDTADKQSSEEVPTTTTTEPEKKEEPVVDQNYDTSSPGDMAKLKQDLPLLKSGDKLFLFDKNDKKYSITAVAKTTDLGGKGKGGTLGPERAAIADLQQQLDQIGKPITIVFNEVSYANITKVVNIKENQKADFAFATDSKPLLFISYKPGSTVKSIISYGGISSISEKSRDVKAFVDAIKNKVTDFKGLGYEFSVPINDKGVILRSMYGSDFGSKEYGMNNVQAIMQGDIKLVDKGNTYIIEANHIITSPEIPDGEYTPVLNARYAGDRNQMGINHCRIGIVPQGARANVKSPF